MAYVCAAITVLASSGCTGHAEVHIVPLGTKRIDTKAPLIVRVSPDECYFWVNDQEELCVAMRSHSRSIFGKRFGKEFLLSLVAKGLPAGGGREYRMDRRTARVRHDAGYTHTRAASLSGILAVWNYRRNQLQGRFRFTTREQSYSVLKGWSGNSTVLLIGEFKAVHHEAAGKKLFARTEEGSMSRSAQAPNRATIPASSAQQDSK